MRNLRIASVWGIPIQLHISLLVFLPIVVWLIASGEQIGLYASVIDGLAPADLDRDVLQEGANPWLIGTLAAIGLFASVAVHELGHAYAARRYGIGIQSITLWIFGGLAALETMPREWNREFWIAIAGPVTSVGLAGALLVVLQAIPSGVPIVLFVVGWLAVINIVLAIFNMLPAFPMDGGRILRALLARNYSYARATQVAARVGVVFALLFAVLGVFGGNPVLVLIALFVYLTATTESRTILLEELLTGLTADQLMDDSSRSISAETSIAEFRQRMLRDRHTEYVVVSGERGDDKGGTIVGVVTLADLRNVDRDAYETTTVGEIAATDVPAFDLTAPAFDILVGMGSSPLVVVTDGDEPVGTVSRSDLGRVMQLRKRLGTGEPLEKVPM